MSEQSVWAPEHYGSNIGTGRPYQGLGTRRAYAGAVSGDLLNTGRHRPPGPVRGPPVGTPDHHEDRTYARSIVMAGRTELEPVGATRSGASRRRAGPCSVYRYELTSTEMGRFPDPSYVRFIGTGRGPAGRGRPHLAGDGQVAGSRYVRSIGTTPPRPVRMPGLSVRERGRRVAWGRQVAGFEIANENGPAIR